jgi:L-alanine-DL-glutamate epimerase-like enolase superfamily enzyme
LELNYTPYRIQCTHPFGISRSTHDYYDVVYVYLESEGIIGRGEAAPSARYQEFADAILARLEAGIELPESFDDPTGLDLLLSQTDGIQALGAAFSMAFLDGYCRKRGLSLVDYFGGDPKNTPLTSYTISIGDLDLIPQKIAEAQAYPILKVKLGLGKKQDQTLIRLVREETDKLIRVDANEGWDLETGREMCFWLADQGVEFVEQPFKADRLQDTAELKRQSPLPIIADENSLTSADIPVIASAFDGINIKLMKCGSLLEAKRMIDTAREHGLKIMLGCMVESSVGITAAAHLSPFVDYADLDGNLLISNDPYRGVLVQDGRLILPVGNGLGVTLDSSRLAQDKTLK